MTTRSNRMKFTLGSWTRCGRCGAWQSVRLKPTAVRLMANPTASETGQGVDPGTARPAERGSSKLLSTLAKGLC